jgi:hypothetical protein
MKGRPRIEADLVQIVPRSTAQVGTLSSGRIQRMYSMSSVLTQAQPCCTHATWPPMLARSNMGLGQMVLNATNSLRTDIVIMGIIVIGVVA